MFAIVMAIYLMFSLTTSLLLNAFNRRVQLVER
jgi:ABC-type amino acid transport system permease subunit